MDTPTPPSAPAAADETVIGTIQLPLPASEVARLLLELSQKDPEAKMASSEDGLTLSVLSRRPQD